MTFTNNYNEQETVVGCQIWYFNAVYLIVNILMIDEVGVSEW